MSASKPRLAMISIGIRRDLLAPLKYLSQFELAHLYRKSEYGDLTPDDFDSTLHPYSSPLALYQQLVHLNPDVIQSVEPFSFYTQPYLWASYLAAHKTNASMFAATFENRPLQVKFGSVRAALLQKALRIFFERACLIITLNAGARENVLRCNAAPEKIARALWGSWGVDTREFFPRTERSPQGSNRAPLILFVGRLHQEKGVFVLLDAFARVHAKISNTRLLFVGDGPARADLESRARGMKDAVQFAGVVKHREIPEIFRNADIFCAPSLTTPKWAEQVGMSALQAMASGLPIVSTQSGAIPEYIPDGLAGILVEENNSRALANALIDLISNPERARDMGARGCDYARTHYDARSNIVRGEQLVMEHCGARRV